MHGWSKLSKGRMCRVNGFSIVYQNDRSQTSVFASKVQTTHLMYPKGNNQQNQVIS